MAPWLNFILQLIAIASIVIGVLSVRNAKIRFHGLAMFVAVLLNAFSIIFVMLPSATRILVGAKVTSFTVFIALHSILGIIAEILGVYFVWVWRNRQPGESCFKFRKYMKIVNLFWFGIFIVGVIIFYQLYF
jgi:uncharacterized membrane protein YozB (DUF420 family)